MLRIKFKQPYEKYEKIKELLDKLFYLFRRNKEDENVVGKRNIFSQDIYDSYSKANPEFKLSIDEKSQLDMIKFEVFTIDDIHKIAMLKPDDFEIINYRELVQAFTTKSLKEDEDNSSYISASWNKLEEMYNKISRKRMNEYLSQINNNDMISTTFNNNYFFS